MSTELLFALACSLVGIAYGVITIKTILAKPAGDDEMQRIQGAIQEGASAYLKRQYSAISVVGVIIFLVIFFALNAVTAIGFAIGAIFSGLAGFIGMHVSVSSNARTAEAAKLGIHPSLQIAFKGGAITGHVSCLLFVYWALLVITQH